MFVLTICERTTSVFCKWNNFVIIGCYWVYLFDRHLDFEDSSCKQQVKAFRRFVHNKFGTFMYPLFALDNHKKFCMYPK